MKLNETIVISWTSRLFSNFKKKKSGQEPLSRIFLPNREKGREPVFGTTTESNSLGPIGADFARQKVFLYEIDDEEVI